MKKIKVLVEGVTSLVGGRETYIMTQYECIDTSCFHFDFVYDLSVGEFPERYIGEVTSKGSKVLIHNYVDSDPSERQGTIEQTTFKKF